VTYKSRKNKNINDCNLFEKERRHLMARVLQFEETMSV
jgi:hypothetical protein